MDQWRKKWCRELAELLSRGDGMRLLQLMELTGNLNAPRVDRARPNQQDRVSDRDVSEGPRSISIWEPETLEGQLYFTRPDPLAFGDHYGLRKRFPALVPAGKKRICFFGESVAAGYLYAPHITPAGVLAQQLARRSGDFEVLDFARTNETLSGLRETVARCLQIDPDMLVVFAGNNWNLLETTQKSPYVPLPESRQDFARSMRAEGLYGPIEEAASELLQKAAASLNDLGRMAERRGIPLVLVIPEVNLLDWENLQPVSWLPGDRTPQWHGLYGQAMAAMEQKQWSELRSIAVAMGVLDEGSCPTSYRFLARAYLGLGNRQAALVACRAEVDSNHYAGLCFLGAPQIGSLGRALQKRLGSLPGFHTIDLARVFEQYTGSPLTDRRLFLDYCHLTVEGMQVAMAAVTAKVLTIFASPGSADGVGLLDELPAIQVDKDVDAAAKLGAAIHNAHRLLPLGSKAAILEYWCRQALKASPSIKETMMDLIEARCAPCPAVLTRAQLRNFNSPHLLTPQHGWRYDYLDAQLIDIILSLLAPSERAAMLDLIIRYRGLGESGMDLLENDGFFLWEPLFRFYPELMKYDDLAQRAVFRAAWSSSGFCVITEGEGPVQIELTARLGEPRKNGSQIRSGASITVNDRAMTGFELEPRWRQYAFMIEKGWLKRGLNRLDFYWPPLPAEGEILLESRLRQLEMGREVAFHPVFAELFSLRLTPVSSPE